MRKIILLIVILLMGATANFGQDISPMIPEGWQLINQSDGRLAIVNGDLNKDGIEDVAFVIEETKIYDDTADRKLVIAFGNGIGGYHLSALSYNAILHEYEECAYDSGDPFDSISIDRGSLLLNFYFTSDLTWYRSYRFRYQDEDWYLIGATEGSFVAITGGMDTIEKDYNLLTGDYVFKELEDGKVVTYKGNRGCKNLISLKNFDVYEMKEDFELLEDMENRPHQSRVWEGIYHMEDYVNSTYAYIEIEFIGKERFRYTINTETEGNQFNYSGEARVYGDNYALSAYENLEFILDKTLLIIREPDKEKTAKDFYRTSYLTEDDFKLSNALHKDMSHIEFKERFNYNDEIKFDIDEDAKELLLATAQLEGVSIDFLSSYSNPENSSIYRFELTNPEITTHRGIRVGDSIDTLLIRYGEPDDKTNGVCSYSCGAFHLDFEFENNKIKRIIYWAENIQWGL